MVKSFSKVMIFLLMISIVNVVMFSSSIVSARSLSDRVSVNTRFNKGDYLLSQNGKYKAVWQHDGNFVVYRVSNMKALWSTNTYNMGDDSRLAFEAPGTLVIRKNVVSKRILVKHSDPHDSPSYKNTNSYETGGAGTVSYKVHTSLYYTETMFFAKNPSERTKVQRVIVGFDKLQREIYVNVNTPKDDVLWHSTLGNHGAGAYLVMQNDGNLVIYNGSNRAVWASNTCE